MLIWCFINDLLNNFFSGVVERKWNKCGGEEECPHPCVCADGVVDCRDLTLKSVPDSLPEDVIELYVIDILNIAHFFLKNYLSYSCICFLGENINFLVQGKD